MDSAQSELSNQFEKKIADQKLSTKNAIEALKKLRSKDEHIYNLTQELNWAKGALKSNEVNHLLEKLPGLLMETAKNTLTKQK